MTKAAAAGHIIGRGGANIQRLQETHKVEITSRSYGEDFKMVIAGTADNVQRAHNEILKSIRTNTAVPAGPSHRQATDAKKTTCKYFLQGECRFGDKCRNRHPTTKRGRSPDRTNRQSPDRKRRPERSSSNKPTGRFSTLT